jgi:hypothetical protein
VLHAVELEEFSDHLHRQLAFLGLKEVRQVFVRTEYALISAVLCPFVDCRENSGTQLRPNLLENALFLEGLHNRVFQPVKINLFLVFFKCRVHPALNGALRL